MTRLLSILAAGALALSVSGAAVAQDQNQQGGGQQPQAQEGDASQREQDLQAALRKCEPLTGADKTKCIDEAKKKHGQM